MSYMVWLFFFCVYVVRGLSWLLCVFTAAVLLTGFALCTFVCGCSWFFFEKRFSVVLSFFFFCLFCVLFIFFFVQLLCFVVVVVVCFVVMLMFCFWFVGVLGVFGLF